MRLTGLVAAVLLAVAALATLVPAKTDAIRTTP
jgi:hypothetical protein